MRGQDPLRVNAGGGSMPAACFLSVNVNASTAGAAAHRLGEACVVVELAAQSGDGGQVTGNVREVRLRELLQDGEAARRVALGEEDVEADRPRLVPAEQLIDKQRQPVARPRKAAFAQQARLVDVDDDDLRVGGAGCVARSRAS